MNKDLKGEMFLIVAGFLCGLLAGLGIAFIILALSAYHLNPVAPEALSDIASGLLIWLRIKLGGG